MGFPLEEVMVTLRRVVAEKGPDFVYEPVKVVWHNRENGVVTEEVDEQGCVYLLEGKPSCIAAHVMWELGIREFAEGHPADMQPWSDDMDALAVEALSRAQLIQDCGGTWGEALAQAEMFAAGYKPPWPGSTYYARDI